MRIFLYVDPRTRRLPPSRLDGADPVKLQRQIARYGQSVQGMPPLFVYRGSDGELMITDGVTRATRVAKLISGVHSPGGGNRRASHAVRLSPNCRERLR